MTNFFEPISTTIFNLLKKNSFFCQTKFYRWLLSINIVYMKWWQSQNDLKTSCYSRKAKNIHNIRNRHNCKDTKASAIYDTILLATKPLKMKEKFFYFFFLFNYFILVDCNYTSIIRKPNEKHKNYWASGIAHIIL